MSGTTPIQPGTAVHGTERGWRVRAARRGDVPAVAGAIREMLFELGGTPPPLAGLKDTALAVIEDDQAGALFVAEVEGEGEGEGQLVGVLGMSWQIAVRVPGRYGLIQELWVSPAWRGMTIGHDLLAALFGLADERQVKRIEVGLPSERFPHLKATEDFYLAGGFTAIGTRMRRLLP